MRIPQFSCILSLNMFNYVDLRVFANYHEKNDIVDVTHMLSRDVENDVITTLINKSADWPPNYHKILIFFLKKGDREPE